MIRNLTISLNVLVASRGIGKYRRQQILRPNSLDLRRNFLTILKTQQRERPVRIPPPARSEDRKMQCRLLQNRLYGLCIQKVKNIGERKPMLLRQSNLQAFFGPGCMQLE